MQLQVYYDRDMLYTNRKIIDLGNRVYDLVNIKSFNGGDTINASIIFNDTENKGLPTYVKIVDGTFNGFQYYVTANKFIRKNQWNLTLLRDIISDNTCWRSAPAFIKSGYNNQNDMKYNRYKFNLNAIKTKQELLSNELSLVMFFNQRRNEEGVAINFDMTADTTQFSPIYATYSDMDEFPYKDCLEGTGRTIKKENPYMNFRYQVKSTQSYSWWLCDGFNYLYCWWQINTKNTNAVGNFGKTGTDASSSDIAINTRVELGGTTDTNGNEIKINNFNITDIVNNALIQNTLDNFKQSIDETYKLMNGQIIQIGTKTYRCVFTTTTAERSGASLINNVSLHNLLFSQYNLKKGSSFTAQNIDYNNTPLVYYTETKLKLVLEEFTISTLYSVTVPATTPTMDYIPTKALVINGLTRETYLSWILWCIRIMENSPEVIQTQLLPFNVDDDGEFATQTGNMVKMLIKRDHTFTKSYTYTPDNEFVDKEGKFIRITSASGATYMDITPYINGGLEQFNFDLSIKPFGTTIYVQPQFAGLYRQSFDDKRGIVIQEDFSISKIDNAWVTYKYQNQNYLNTFNRQLQSVELSNYYAREGDRLALDRADEEAKALARQNTSSKWGMFDKLLLSIPSMIGGYTDKSRQQYNEAVQLDVEMNEVLRQDNVALQKEIFNNNLANIKAIAPTINRVDNFDILYKYSIIIETYECSDSEKEYIINYYQHNGAVIGTLGFFSDYYGLVVSGKLIFCERYTQEELNEVNRRLEGGIRTGYDINKIYTNRFGEQVEVGLIDEFESIVGE